MFAGSAQIVACLAVSACVFGATLGARNMSKVYTGAIALSHEEMDQHPSYPKNLKTRSDIVLPDTFNAADKWGGCTSIRTIRSQGACGVCWAVSSASVIADRLCIATGQDRTDFIAASQIAGCTDYTTNPRDPHDRCIHGYDVTAAMRYVALYGVASGAEYQSEMGCYPYTVGDSPVDQICPDQCSTSSDPLDIQDHQIDSYWTAYLAQGYTQSDIDKAVLRMKTDIYQNGPIVVCLQAESDFQPWNNPDAPYDRMNYWTGGINHAVRIVGWGRTQGGVPYWDIANSWGTGLGLDGHYYITLGKNTAGIEAYNYAPIVDMSRMFTCDASTFCSAPISQAITINPSDPNSDTFLFQGNCLLPVSKLGGQISATGPAVPIQKIFMGAPDGPIVGYSAGDDGVALNNPSGSAGLGCVKVDGTPKYSCGRGTFNNMGPVVVFIDPSGAQVKYTYDAKQNWIFVWNGGSGQGVSQPTLFAESGMTQVTAFLDIDGTSCYVFGADSSGQTLIGVMAYPTDGSSDFMWTTQPAGQGNSLLSCG